MESSPNLASDTLQDLHLRPLQRLVTACRLAGQTRSNLTCMYSCSEAGSDSQTDAWAEVLPACLGPKQLSSAIQIASHVTNMTSCQRYLQIQNCKKPPAS